MCGRVYINGADDPCEFGVKGAGQNSVCRFQALRRCQLNITQIIGNCRCNYICFNGLCFYTV